MSQPTYFIGSSLNILCSVRSQLENASTRLKNSGPTVRARKPIMFGDIKTKPINKFLRCLEFIGPGYSRIPKVS